jgi:lysozyme family protein
MSPRFEAFIPFVLKHETAYRKGHWGDDAFVITERDPSDPGGTTRYGIDYGEHKESPWNLTESDIDHLTKTQAIDIYWRHWQIDGCEHLEYPLGEVFFNCATMSGRGQANLILKRQNTVSGYLRDELHVFDLIVQRRPASKKYVDGWKDRIVDEAKLFHIELT